MQSTVHCVLTCPNLLLKIFSWLHLPETAHMNGYHDAAHEDRKARRRTLPSVALVCRAFTPCALDTMWCTMNKLQPLLSLLPAIYYNVDEDTYVSRDRSIIPASSSADHAMMDSCYLDW